MPTRSRIVLPRAVCDAFLLFGAYNKLVKQLGSDRTERLGAY